MPPQKRKPGIKLRNYKKKKISLPKRSTYVKVKRGGPTAVQKKPLSTIGKELSQKYETAVYPVKKPYVKKTYTPKSRYADYVKPGSMRTNDKHFDEKIAKSEIIMNQISRGMDVAAKPIAGIIHLAEQYAGKAGSFISKFFTKK